MPGKNREGYVRPNPPGRTGRFMGGYFAQKLARRVENEVYAKPGATMTGVLSELLSEALDARDKEREAEREGEK